MKVTTIWTLRGMRLTDRTKMVACAVALGACFAIGLPANAAGQRVIFGIAYFLSLPLSAGIGYYQKRAEKEARR